MPQCERCVTVSKKFGSKCTEIQLSIVKAESKTLSFSQLRIRFSSVDLGVPVHEAMILKQVTSSLKEYIPIYRQNGQKSFVRFSKKKQNLRFLANIKTMSHRTRNLYPWKRLRYLKMTLSRRNNRIINLFMIKTYRLGYSIQSRMRLCARHQFILDSRRDSIR